MEIEDRRTVDWATVVIAELPTVGELEPLAISTQA